MHDLRADTPEIVEELIGFLTGKGIKIINPETEIGMPAYE
jgi:hypothetical protein